MKKDLVSPNQPTLIFDALPEFEVLDKKLDFNNIFEKSERLNFFENLKILCEFVSKKKFSFFMLQVSINVTKNKKNSWTFWGNLILEHSNLVKE